MRYAWITAAMLLILFRSAVIAQLPPGTATDPHEANLIYDDVKNFAQTLKVMSSGCDSAAIVQREYLDKASPGLKYYIDDLGLTAEAFVKAIRKRPSEFAALQNLPQKLIAQEKMVRDAFVKLKQFIPDAVFLPTYLVIGPWRNHSEASEQGLLISVEGYHGAEDNVCTIAHEHTHIQQALSQGLEQYQAIYGPEKSLLALTIREGTADFFAYLITERITLTHDWALDYTQKHEKMLWERFRKEMHGRETGDWMWAKPKDTEQPRDVGYSLGLLIVQAYYDNADDKAQAVREILSVIDSPAFLEKSGYAKKFADQ